MMPLPPIPLVQSIAVVPNSEDRFQVNAAKPFLSNHVTVASIHRLSDRLPQSIHLQLRMPLMHQGKKDPAQALFAYSELL